MTPTDLTTALTEVRDAIDVPAPDRVALQARVRTERRRRTAGRAALAVAAAGVVAAAALTLPGRGTGDDRGAQVAEESTGAVALPLDAPVWFVLDHRLTALDPAGVTHQLDVEVESVVGWNAQIVYAVRTDGVLVQLSTSWDASRSRFETVSAEPVVEGPVDGAEVSGDGHRLAWAQDGEITVRDARIDRTEVLDLDGATGLAAVGSVGVLVSGDRELMLRDGEREVDVPLPDGEYGAAAQLAGDRVLVPLRDGRSQLWDVSGRTARLEAELTGMGRLGPFAERIALVSGEPASLEVVEIGPDGPFDVPVSGLDDLVPDTVRWADETLLLVDGHEPDGTPALAACDIEMACTRLPVVGDVGLQ